ncbi:Hypothetical predicted protein [Cloeon dipterum]|uniref:C-type lectin domain-containing protein n=1 Tax=Cloeon dipterum TaxID=197152 RepID=A0A8S1DZS8_9INSE|nr:Hypothetical predicted protein [Cloeon dipterum]
MTLLTVTSFEELDCINNFKGTFWTSGSNEDLNCDTSNKYAWCSTGYEVSPSLLSSSKFWLSANASPSTLQRCMAVSIPLNSANKGGMVLRNCQDQLPFVCQYSVDCPKLCRKNDLLFDSAGQLINKTSHGFWINLGAYTYLFGNKLVTWLSNWQQCCALGMEPLNMDNADEQTGLKGLTVRFKDDWKMNFNYWTSGTWQGSPQKMWSWCEPNGPTVFPPGLIWEAGQPDNRDGNETCVHFRFILNSTGAIMTDRNCTSKYVFACKGNLVTTPKPCVASCPNETCQRDPNLFNPTDQSLYNFFSYGTWYDRCGRNFLTYTSNASNWATAWNQCCRVGMTLASMESAGKTSCYAKIVSTLDGDFWVSGTDLGCVSNFRWCSRNQDFVDSELKWKAGHPKAGLNCVYLEVRNKSVLLATASCAEKKDFLCEVRKKNSYQKAMQAECAETWDITTDQIDLLLNVSRFLTTTVSLNLKCFLKCVGVEVGMFALGGLMSIETLRNIELVSQEEPKKLEQGFVAYDQCSGQNSGDECVTAYETFKCGQEKAPDLVQEIVTNNFDNKTVFLPPTPCVPVPRTCWISSVYPCVINQTAIDLFKKDAGYYVDHLGSKKVSNSKIYYVSDYDISQKINPIDAYLHCCALGLRLFEPATADDMFLANQATGSQTPLLVGEMEAINQTHEVWCRSRKVVPDNVYQSNAHRYICHQAIFLMYTQEGLLDPQYTTGPSGVIDEYLKRSNTLAFVPRFICEEP